MANFSELIKSNKPVLVDFYTVWCGPCKTLKPILETVKEKMGNEATILNIDLDKNLAAARKYQITSVPTLILFKNGKVAWRKTGVVPAEDIEKAIKKHS